MPKVSRKKLSQETWNTFERHFWKAVAMLKTEQEAEKFFRDLLTPTETKMLSKRLEAATMLTQDKNYEEIRKELGLGNSTIANVHNWLEAGSGGLKAVAERLLKELKQK